MPEFHRRVLNGALDACHAYGMVLAGGYAMRAHGLVDRPSQDLDFATITPTPLAEVASALTSSYRAAGLDVETVRGTHVLGRLIVSDRETGQVLCCRPDEAAAAAPAHHG